MFLNCYQGRRVLVTGHTGFKGSWLVAWLMQLGAQVAGFANGYVSEPCHFKVLGLDQEQRVAGKGSFTNYQGDVRDLPRLHAVLQEFKPEIVLHLAAQALVRPSYAEPVETFTINAMGTLHVLEAIRHCDSVKAVVCITSDKAYRNDEWVWGYRETDHLGGEDPYSASKGCAEFVANSYFKCFFKDKIAAATTRAGNVIGGGDWAQDRIIPDCAKAWQQNQAVEIRSPNATRPWQHVLEPLSGYLWLGALLFQEQSHKDQGMATEQSNCQVEQPSCQTGRPKLAGEAFNFGPSADASYSVAQVVQALQAQWPGFQSKMNQLGTPELKECTLLKLCCDKSLAYLQWHSTLNFTQTMQFTADWYKFYFQKQPQTMLDFTCQQITQYADLSQQAGLAWAAKS